MDGTNREMSESIVVPMKGPWGKAKRMFGYGQLGVLHTDCQYQNLVVRYRSVGRPPPMSRKEVFV